MTGPLQEVKMEVKENNFRRKKMREAAGFDPLNPIPASILFLSCSSAAQQAASGIGPC